jgi:hypothetical protein
MNTPSHPEPQPGSSGSVFGKSITPQDVLGHLPCPSCTHAIAYTAQQIGTLTNCPKCGGTAIRVGHSLVEEMRPEKRAVLAKPTAVLAPRRPWLNRHTLGFASMLLLFGLALTAAAVLTSSQTVSLSSGWLTWKSVSARSGEMPVGTAESEAARGALPPPEITLEQIEQLMTQADMREALVQAQVWQQMLRDFGIPNDDHRLRRLAELIAYFTEQLKPKPTPPPAYLGEFRRALDDLREALRAENLASARAALAIAEAIFKVHGDELAMFSRSYLALKQRFGQLELIQEGKQRISELLTTADQLIRRDEPTEAAEAIAKAMFLALRTPMEEAEFQQRDQAVRQLIRDLRLARGKRAVADAQRCQKESDLAARDIQLSVAMELLPDLPADRVTSLLTQARSLSEMSIANPTPSSFGRELAFRAVYEDALNCYGRRNALSELAERCSAAQELLQSATTLEATAGDKLSDLILGALESEVGDLLLLPPRSPEVASGLAQVRAGLEKASAWREATRWKSVDKALQSKGDEVASLAIEQASKRAEAGDLAAAIELIEPAQTLASGALRTRAEGLSRQWQQTLERQASIAAQDEAWNDMRTLYREGHFLEVWEKAAAFDRQFPNSPRKGEVAGVRAAIRDRVDQEVAALVQQMEQWLTDREWAKFRAGFERLQEAPRSDAWESQFLRFEEIAADMSAHADRQFRNLGTFKHMTNDSDVVSLQQALREILELNPDHQEAGDLQKKAQERATQLAQYFLLKSRSASKETTAYREMLEKVLRLDPDGEFGGQARELLDKLDSTGGNEAKAG